MTVGFATTATPGVRPAAPTVIVATTYDVRSSLRWAEALATELGAPLIRFIAAGHAIVGQGNACIDAQVTAFLITPLTPLLSRDC